jgi:hypothetical protein
MIFGSAPRYDHRFGRLVGGTLLGTTLVVAGLLMAYLAMATPLIRNLVPAQSGDGRASIGLGVLSFALIAGGSLLVAGTSRLAVILALLRHGRGIGGPAGRTHISTSGEIAVASDVIPREGRPIPELVIGVFGVAVIHTLPSSKQVRHGPAGWEARSGDGWQPIEDPLGAATRDADRVRRWLGNADLDFVVRVYAALVADDRALERSPTCAVINSQQVPAWIASLPRQRTLTAGRRGRLLAMARTPANAGPAGRTTSW